MIYTLKQLEPMSDYEINCAVAEKLGYYALLHENMDEKELYRLKKIKGKNAIYVEEPCRSDDDDVEWFQRDYCKNPSDYMPIAIDHGISINFGKVDYVWATKGEGFNSIDSGAKELDQTGIAVCECFLLMDITL